MTKFVWGLFVFFAVWLAVGLVGSFFISPFFSFVLGFFIAVWAGAKA